MSTEITGLPPEDHAALLVEDAAAWELAKKLGYEDLQQEAADRFRRRIYSMSLDEWRRVLEVLAYDAGRAAAAKWIDDLDLFVFVPDRWQVYNPPTWPVYRGRRRRCECPDGAGDGWRCPVCGGQRVKPGGVT